MTLTIASSRSSTSDSRSRGRTTEEGESVLDLRASVLAPADALEERFGRLVRMRPGWAGPGSVPPSHVAISALRRAAASVEGGRSRIGASPHPDGYINVEWQRGQIWYTAHIWADRVEMFVDDEMTDEFYESSAALSDDVLIEFLRHSE